MKRTAVAAGTGVLALAAISAVAVWAPWGATADDESRWSSTYQGLCRAAARADAGEVEAARRVFYDEAHESLHSLAKRTARNDRRRAARLLEAKERVETSLDGPTGLLVEDLRALVNVTRRAAAAVADPVAQRCHAQG